MRITAIEDLHADGGWRVFSFLKVSTDQGLVGWSEYNETSWNPGLTAIISKLAETLVGRDPRAFGRIGADLRAATRMAPGGLADQAIAAIENACVDLAAKAAGVPACALFGGPLRERIPLYWSHCGSFRASMPELFREKIGGLEVSSLDGVEALGREVRRRGYKALKTNPILFDGPRPQMTNPGFRPGLELGRNGDPALYEKIAAQLAAFRAGAGEEVGLLLDVNFGFSAEGLRQLARRLEPLGLFWLEADMHMPAALAEVRRAVKTPIASLESIYRVKGYHPYFEQGSADVAIIDVVWNGLPESVRIANLAEAYEVNVAPHNFYGHISSLISAHFCAAVPNLRIMEYEADDVPWKDDLVTTPPVVENGELVLPSGPGWGADVNEEAVRAHPPSRA
jgi:L-alanine-DL-glutamate epimerase-like enolase superfamily enzyme